MRNRALILCAVFAMALLGCRTTSEEPLSVLHSDHIDGPATSEHSITDLTDFYVYPTPYKEGYITMVLNVHPLSRDHNHFSDKVNYRFFIRPVDAHVQGSGDTAQVNMTTDASRELEIVCTFKTPEDHTQHSMTCKVPGVGGDTVTFNDKSTVNISGKVRLYHGLRADPFFFNAKWAESAAAEGKLLQPKDSNIMDKTNCLTVIVEFKPADAFGNDVALLGAAVQSYTFENGAIKTLDRLGRPEVTNVTMVARGQLPDLRDRYNLETPFAVSAAGRQDYLDRIVDNVANFDQMDGKVDWQQAKKENYGRIIVDDYLLFDMRYTDKPAKYFAIEHALLKGTPANTFGGRALNNDIMDTLFGILINYDGGPVADGVGAPYKPVSNNFPYLADPDQSWAGWAKARLARWRLGIKDNE